MKTVKDWENMRSKGSMMFGTEYNYFIATLEDDYIKRSNGVDVIAKKLSDWDNEARSLIVDDVIKKLRRSGVYVNIDELRGLII